MDEPHRVMIEAALKLALEKENPILDNESAVFKYLKGIGLPTNVIYDNTDEIEIIWKRLSGIPPTPSSEPLEAPPQNTDAEKSHGDDQAPRGIRVPVFDKDVEPVMVLVTKHDDGTFDHANTRHCEGVESYISIRAVERMLLQRKEDGTVIVSWLYTKKHMRHHQITNQAIRHTRCTVLEGEDAEAMQVDILWGEGYEAGVTYLLRNSPTGPDPPKATSPPQTLPSLVMEPSTDIPSNGTMATSSHKPVLVQTQTLWFPHGIPEDQLSMKQFSPFHFPAISYGMGPMSNNMSPFGAGHPNGDLIPSAPASSMAGHLHAANLAAIPPVPGMNGTNSVDYAFRDPLPGHQGKRKADDEAGTYIKSKRPTTNHQSTN
ncbi:hypothetical protein F5Y13DRAFT_96222 [Hypoxylon sp. FL1857]|nr:hypothetical protein F5Y13DRAFT_96222 [Hypoxylon sp. FL1857]